MIDSTGSKTCEIGVNVNSTQPGFSDRPHGRTVNAERGHPKSKKPLGHTCSRSRTTLPDHVVGSLRAGHANTEDLMGELKIGLRLKGDPELVKIKRREIFSYLHSLGFEPGGTHNTVEAVIRGSKDFVMGIRDKLAAMANSSSEGNFETFGSD